MGKEHKVAAKQGAGLCVEHREIVVAVRGRPRPQEGNFRRQIQFEFAVY